MRSKNSKRNMLQEQQQSIIGATNMKKLRKGEAVWVNFEDGDASENYTGPGTFLRYLKKDEPCYEYLEQPHAFVKIGPEEMAVFPLYSIASLEQENRQTQNDKGKYE
jgi:hypothetical protein